MSGLEDTGSRTKQCEGSRQGSQIITGEQAEGRSAGAARWVEVVRSSAQIEEEGRGVGVLRREEETQKCCPGAWENG